MKTRLGFVSNSSSASYYVRLKGSRTEALQTITSECSWPYFQKDAIVATIDEKIKSLKSRLDYFDRVSETFLMGTKDDTEKRIQELENIKLKVKAIFEERGKRWKKMNLDKIEKSMNDLADELLDIVFKLNFIKIDKETEEEFAFSSTTIMHNNYVEGMPDLLKDIVLYYTFEEPSKISLRVEHDG